MQHPQHQQLIAAHTPLHRLLLHQQQRQHQLQLQLVLVAATLHQQQQLPRLPLQQLVMVGPQGQPAPRLLPAQWQVVAAAAALQKQVRCQGQALPARPLLLLLLLVRLVLLPQQLLLLLLRVPPHHRPWCLVL